MCGICAILSFDGPVDPGDVERGVERLHHRGPDARGFWTSPDGRLGLGHARLSIIDLATGDQPLQNEDGSLRAIVNGEFYDFERIRSELEGRGHAFRTHSDSEILLHLYEEMGPHCLHRLRGEFAFVLWDGRNRQLFAGRDRFGVKPLFFALHGNRLCLASEVKALFAAGVPAAWDLETVYLGGFLRATHRTLYRGVRCVPPGYYLVARPEGGHRLHQYWDVTYPAGPVMDGRPERDYVEGFRRVFEEAVKTRLRADVPVGCYLSGGLDSCATLGVAALHHAGPVRAFTLQFDGPQYDESEVAQEMAARAGADFVPIPIRQSDLADHFADAVLASETWSINAHGVAKYLLSRAVRDAGYKVVLTGEGSDEILGGYPHFRQDMLSHHTEGQDPEELKRLLQELASGNQVSRGVLLPEGESDPADIVRSMLGFVPTWLDTHTGTVLRLRKLYDDDFLNEHVGKDGFAHLFSSIDVPSRLQGRNAVHAALYLWAKTALPDYILTVLGDRMEMAHSVEGRVPFLDHHVAEYLHGVPVALKIRGMTEKYILREAVKDVITDTVYRRQKHPFLSPPATLHPEEELHTLMQDTLRGSAVDVVPFLDRRKVSAFLDGLAEKEMDFGARIVADQVLTLALSSVFLQQGLGLQS